MGLVIRQQELIRISYVVLSQVSVLRFRQVPLIAFLQKTRTRASLRLWLCCIAAVCPQAEFKEDGNKDFVVFYAIPFASIMCWVLICLSAP